MSRLSNIEIEDVFLSEKYFFKFNSLLKRLKHMNCARSNLSTQNV